MRAKDLTPKRQVIILKVDGKPLIKSTDQQKILDFQKFLKQKDPNLKIEVIQQRGVQLTEMRMGYGLS